MTLQPTIQVLQELKLIGEKVRMSFTGNKTYELWQNFMSRRREINNSLSSNLYSVEVYDSPAFFEKI